MNKAEWKRFVEKLEAFCEKEGYSLSPTGLRGTQEMNGSLTVKFNMSPKDTDTDKKTWDLYAASFGLRPEHYGREIHYSGRKFKLTSFERKSYKFPVVATEVGTGKRFKLPAEGVKSALEKAA